MTFKQAYKYAYEHSAIFRKHDERVKHAKRTGESTPVLIFSVEPGETFYYGFDGVDVQTGKHAPKRSVYLINRDEVLIIREGN